MVANTKVFCALGCTLRYPFWWGAWMMNLPYLGNIRGCTLHDHQLPSDEACCHNGTKTIKLWPHHACESVFIRIPFLPVPIGRNLEGCPIVFLKVEAPMARFVSSIVICFSTVTSWIENSNAKRNVSWSIVKQWVISKSGNKFPRIVVSLMLPSRVMERLANPIFTSWPMQQNLAAFFNGDNWERFLDEFQMTIELLPSSEFCGKHQHQNPSACFATTFSTLQGLILRTETQPPSKGPTQILD